MSYDNYVGADHRIGSFLLDRFREGAMTIADLKAICADQGWAFEDAYGAVRDLIQAKLVVATVRGGQTLMQMTAYGRTRIK